MVIRPAVVWLISILVHSSLCYGDPKSDFDSAYKQYQYSVDKGEGKLALESAELAYDLGKDLFGESNINTGNLAFNYGELLNDFSRFKEAKPILSSARKILRAHHGKKSPELINVYFELGKASYNNIRPGTGLTPLGGA